jgi:hypothetical protein
MFKMVTYTHISISLLLFCFFLVSEIFLIPSIQQMNAAIETFYLQQAEIQIDEIRQTKKFHWFSYLPSPGYSPFTGGFTVSLNLASPLQEIRLTHTQKTRIEAIKKNNKQLADDLKNSIKIDYQHIQNLVADFIQHSSLDSLNTLTYDLARKKYKSNEITPSEFIAASKVQAEFKLSRQKEEHAIQEAINSLIYKAKMDVPASNAHLNNLTNK